MRGTAIVALLLFGLTGPSAADPWEVPEIQERDDSIENLERMLERGDRPLNEVQILNALEDAYSLRREYDRAEAYARRALVLEDELGFKEPAMQRARQALASHLLRKPWSAEGEAFFLETLERSKEHRISEMHWIYLSMRYFQETGRLHDALALANRELDAQLPCKQKPLGCEDYGRIELLIADTYAHADDPRAEGAYNQALATLMASPEGVVRTPDAWTALARIAEARGDYPRSAEALREAIAAWEAANELPTIEVGLDGLLPPLLDELSRVLQLEASAARDRSQHLRELSEQLPPVGAR